MKKLFYLLLIVGLAIVSCNKPMDIITEQGIVLRAMTSATTSFKSDDVLCNNPVAHYALIQLDGGDIMTVDVFYLDGVIYTNTLKLTPGEHTVNMFVLKNDNGTPDDTSDDIEVLATPLEGANYENFVDDALPMTFTTGIFLKNEVDIEVLCFQPTTITDFGFSWFAIDQIIVREFCFFGDICVLDSDDLLAYENTQYANQINGITHDMPAIFKIDVYRDGIFMASYNNEAWLGEGAVLCAQYPDYVGVDDTFTFELWIKVLNASFTDLEYTKYYEWTTVNDGNLPNIGSDNVLDFVLGSCVPDSDLIIPPPDPDPDPDPTYACETAFAYDSSLSSCFIDDGFGNWGWTNGAYSVGTYTLDLIAAAGGCDLSNGQVVGSVFLDYRSDGVVEVTYNVNAGFEMEAVHLYIGSDLYPEIGDDPTVAPGQYTIIDDTLTIDEISTYTFNLNDYFGPIYIIAHADVCGNYSSK